jgi:N-acetylmuramic acid 6-phosphate etherase
VIEHPDIKSFSVLSGPMAVAGSTRLQASTVLMLAIGSALFAQFARQDSECGGHSPDQVGGIFDDFLNMLAATNFSALAPLVERESKVYARGGHCVHRAEEFAITVLTDTTERTPTFSLIPFENDFDPAAELSWTYLSVPHCLSAQEAWLKILGRAPRALAWPRFTAAYGISIVNGFNFSLDAETRREQASGPNGLFHFDIENSAHGLRLALDGEIALLPNAETFLRSDGLASSDVRYSPFHTSLLNSLIIKCALNFTSTLVMGRLGRFQSNLMLFVRSTNNKLIDRSIRYVKILLSEEGFVNFTYDEIATALFELMETVPADQSIVIAVCDHLRAKHAPQRSARFQKS